MPVTAESPPLRILAGSGRSGTTWLQDVLCEANDLHPVFEPLHSAGWSLASKYSRRYAFSDEKEQQRSESELGDIESFWQSLLEGNYPKTWIDYRVRPDRLLPRLEDFKSVSGLKRRASHLVRLLRHRSRFARQPNQGCLVKVIRANLLLPRLAIRPNTYWALVMRHPGAVVESQLRLRGDWNAHRIASRYSVDKGLEMRLGCSWSHWVNQMRSDAELYTLVWCVENVLPLEDIKGGHEHVMFYERLAAKDSGEWKKLLECLSLQHMPKTVDLERPSQQSAEAMGKGTDTYNSSALDRLSSADKSGIQRVLDLVGVGFYHTGSLMPESEKLMASRPWRATQ